MPQALAGRAHYLPSAFPPLFSAALFVLCSMAFAMGRCFPPSLCLTRAALGASTVSETAQDC